MTDTISVERRSALMGRIRGAGNESTEVALAKILREAGLSGGGAGGSVLGGRCRLCRPDCGRASKGIGFAPRLRCLWMPCSAIWGGRFCGCGSTS